MPGRISAAETARRVSASHWGIKVPMIGRLVSGWASLRLISTPVPRTTRLMNPVSSSIAPSMLPCLQKLSAGLLSVAIFATAVDDGPGWANEYQGANRPQTRPEKLGEPGVAVEAALDHVSCAAGEISSQVLDGLAFAAEQQQFVP